MIALHASLCQSETLGIWAISGSPRTKRALHLFERKKRRLIGKLVGAAFRPVKQLRWLDQTSCTGEAGPKLPGTDR